MPTRQSAIFNQKLLQKAIERHLELTQIEAVQQKRAILKNWRQAIESMALKHTGEMALHGDFLIDIFGQVLGYHRQIEHPAAWQLTHEQKTVLDATKSDGALGFFTPDSQDIRAIIELKSLRADLDAKQHRKDEQRSPVEQAFSYAHKAGGKCQWVIVSNYQEVRLYHASFSGKYEVFQLTELAQEAEFLRFYCVLAAPHLLAKTGESLTEALYRQSIETEQAITGQFYAQYTRMRRELFEHLKQQNPERSELALLTHTQQLLDRFIFICFCEDTGDLLPEKTFRKLIQRAKELLALEYEYGDQKVWTELKAVFRAMDQGLGSHHIPGFNGELFKPDPEFETLRIADSIFDNLVQLTDYDFQSELNVNILGHIFEQSLTDLEELRAEIRGEPRDRKQSKRKKEGIFYTPEYITRYIVEQAVGGWLADRRRELGWESLPELTAEDEAWLLAAAKKKKPNPRVERHIAFWEAYLERLKGITVLDPACGSGAFLTQAFDYLRREGEHVNRGLNHLRPGEQLGLFSRKTWDKAILRNNLFGVDLNAESVEITKLSLWLKTAKKDDQLASLAQNIKCGNALIDDPAAGEKAFKWELEFSEIMQRGGFDVVIGNPPYVSISRFSDNWKNHCKQAFTTFDSASDIYCLFYEKGLHLLQEHGFLAYISSNQWLQAQYGKILRDFLVKYSNPLKLIDFAGFRIFQDATVDTSILITKKEGCQFSLEACHVKADFQEGENIIEYIHAHNSIINNLQDRRWFIGNETDLFLKQKIQQQGKLLKYWNIKIFRGILTGLNEAFIINQAVKEKLCKEDANSIELLKPILRGRDVHRYFVESADLWLILSKNGVDVPTQYKAIYNHLLQFGDAVKQRSDQGEHWWNLRACSYYEAFEQEKIIYPETTVRRSEFYLDREHWFVDKTCFIMTGQSLPYLNCILASRLMAWYLESELRSLGKQSIQYSKQYVELIPIPYIPETSQQPFIEKADAMLELNRQLRADAQKFLRFLQVRFHPKILSTKLAAFHTLSFAEFAAKLARQKATLSKKEEFELMELFEEQQAAISALKARMDQTDRELDQMVYQLYGLTAAEIECVESPA